jgi:hypothetical protein
MTTSCVRAAAEQEEPKITLAGAALAPNSHRPLDDGASSCPSLSGPT